MEQEVKILHGLPASGKTTFAKKYVEENMYFKRLSRDDFRHMLDNYIMNSKLENTISKMILVSLEHLLKDGFSVIIDNTNLRPKYITDYMKVIRSVSPDIQVTIHSFSEIPYDTLIERDKNRKDSVGKEVIDRMREQLKNNSVHSLEKTITKFDKDNLHFLPLVEFDNSSSMPEAIICDIDGTLAHIKDRSPCDWKKVGEDFLDNRIYKILVEQKKLGKYVILLSGRDSSCKKETEEWLLKHNVPYDALFMRKEGDQRKDNFVKYELFKNHIVEKFRIDFVLDDRNQVVKMWRQIGLKCLQVEDGDF